MVGKNKIKYTVLISYCWPIIIGGRKTLFQVINLQSFAQPYRLNFQPTDSLL